MSTEVTNEDAWKELKATADSLKDLRQQLKAIQDQRTVLDKAAKPIYDQIYVLKSRMFHLERIVTGEERP